MPVITPANADEDSVSNNLQFDAANCDRARVNCENFSLNRICVFCGVMMKSHDRIKSIRLDNGRRLPPQ